MKPARLPWTQMAPEARQALAGVNAALANSTLGLGLRELVHSRVSQINGCAFCLDMHVRELRKNGETWLRINSLATWRETGFYSARERAALNWAEVMTRLADPHHNHDADFEALQREFSDQEIVELCWAIAQINAWNRMAIGLRSPVADLPIN